jgi:hypothetical protein
MFDIIQTYHNNGLIGLIKKEALKIKEEELK